MKVVKELIDYFYSRGELDKDELAFLDKEGFFTLDPEQETDHDDEEDVENPDIINDEQPLSIEDVEDLKAAAEDSLYQKGKGRRAYKQEKKWSLEKYNNTLLGEIEALDDVFAPLYRLLDKVKKAEMRQALYHSYILDEDYIEDTLRRVLLYHYNQEPELAAALLTTDYLATFFDLTDKLTPKNRDRARAWISGKRLLHPEPNREAISWARQMLDLQIRILKIWRDLTPSVLEHHHNLSYGAPFLTQAADFQNGRLPAQLLMTFVYLHNFDNPPTPETTLIFLLEQEGQNDAAQTMSVFFPSEMHALEQNKPDTTYFDVPFWLHTLNERYNQTLFLATHLWSFDMQRQSLSFPFSHTRNGNKIIFDDTICEKAWFRWTERPHNMEVAAGVFCAEYDEVGVFSEGRAAVQKGDLWGFIDMRGVLVIPCQYKPFKGQDLKYTEGVVPCIRASDDKRLYLDKDGKNAFPQLEKHLGDGIDTLKPFSEGYATVKTKSAYWFVIDDLGRIVLDEETTEDIEVLSDFNEELAGFRQNINELHEYGFINPIGEKFIIKNTATESYNYLHPLREGRAAIRNHQGLWGFVDAQCRLVVPCIYEWAWSFSEDRAAVCRDGLWGFIDPKGHEIIPPQYKITEPFADGFGGFCDMVDKSGFLNRDGDIFKEGYYSTLGFSEGQAIVRKNGRTYFLTILGDENYCYSFNPCNLTDGYVVCLDPPSGLKIMRRNLTTLTTIPNVQSVHYFKKDMNAFEFDRVYMFQEKEYESLPSTVEQNWCLSEGFMGVQTEKTDKWSFAFFDDNVKNAPFRQNETFKTFTIHDGFLLLNIELNIGIKINHPTDSFFDCEFKPNNQVILKFEEEAIMLRLDLIFNKMNFNLS
jgi:WG containing repeat